MQKVISIIFTLLYLIPAIGINGSAHFCGGKIASVSINGFGSKEKCGCGSKTMNVNCCKDRFFSFQIDDDQYKTIQLSFKSVKNFDITPPDIDQVSFNYTNPFVQKRLYHFHHPPNIVKTDLYILHQVFII